MQKVILYYYFVPISDPETIKLWQKELCTRLNLKGRVLIAEHGINGTLGGDVVDVKKYVRTMKQHPLFKGTQYKWSDGAGEDFPKLKVKVRPEIVSFKVGDELQVDEKGVVGGGKHLKPEQLHELLEERGEDVIFYDGRNAYESKIGRFKNTIVPNVKTSKDFVKDIESGEIAKYKDKPIVTYCTGGVRCEILSSMMKNRGYGEVYQIDGGIVKYGEKYKDNGYWEGKLYVFDGRMVTAFSEDAQDLADCLHCNSKTSNFINCVNVKCNKLIIVCEDCAKKQGACSESCEKVAISIIR